MENQIIVPHLWFDKEAAEAVEFYMSIFPESKLTDRMTLHSCRSMNTRSARNTAGSKTSSVYHGRSSRRK
ncbi:VOC family protein [Salinicoccus roseus]|uniref:VOC family protein n=1 Tax=Salinicoccus roseus TaxID=45670 RepID=UPI003D9FF00E